MKWYAYLIILIIATISGGGIIGLISGVAFIIFWEVTGSMGKPKEKYQYLDEQYLQESYEEAPKQEQNSLPNTPVSENVASIPDNHKYVLNAYNNALERVSTEIKRKPNQTEEELIFSSILLTIMSMGIWEKPSNVMGRVCAMSLFRFITFNADESHPSITEKYRQKLCVSQKDLDVQMVKAIEKAHQDPLYDSSTVRTLIMSARAFCFELETHRLVNEYNTYQEFADSVLQIISPVLANNLKNSYPHDPNIVKDAMSLIQKYKEFAIETDDINAMLLVA